MGTHWSHHLDKDTKRCSGCKEIKELLDFSVNAGRYDGLVNYCRPCRAERDTARRERKRKELLESLGGKCVRCGFSDWRALEVDHVNSDGAADRRNPLGNAQSHLTKLVRANPERFQILCSNHNSIKRYEQQECRGRRSYPLNTVAERTLTPRVPSTRTSYSPQRTIEAEARGDALAALVAVRRPVERQQERLPLGSWSRFYERCLGCHETTRSHASDGCCWRCDKLVKGYNRRVSIFGPAVTE